MKKVHLVVRTTSESGTYKESSSKFECPNNHVIVGRKHRGDENGNTVYKYGLLEFENSEDAGKYEILLNDPDWSEWEKESSSSFKCPEGRVLVGREHNGDENGSTRYKTCKVSILLKMDTEILFDELKFIDKKESEDGWVEYQDKDKTFEVMVQRKHSGDENKTTTTCFTKLNVITNGSF